MFLCGHLEKDKLQRVNRLVITRSFEEKRKDQYVEHGTFRAVKLNNTVMTDILHYAFDKIHRTVKHKKCNLMQTMV